MNSKARILFADDDLDLHSLIRSILADTGWRLFLACNGAQAFDLWRSQRLDLAVLDIMMPEMDGLELCRRIRKTSNIPVVLLTAKGMEVDVVHGLSQGADDYIVKPFRAQELKARLQARLNAAERYRQEGDERLAYQNLVIDLQGRQVLHNGRQISLTPIEFHLLRYLIRHAGIALSKQELLYNVWGYVDCAGDLNLIEAAIKRLRKKLELDPSNPEYIQTVWGVGYRFGGMD